MFKDLSSAFGRRKKRFKTSGDKLDAIKETIRLFIKEKFGNNLAGISFGLEYKTHENMLIINTGSKIVANEVTLCLPDLNDFLKKRKIELDKILIR